MAKYIIMPKLGFNMDQGTVVQWLKEEGDAIKEREEVLEIETDKTVMPVEAPCSGILRKILVAEGEVVPVTLPIAIIGDKKEDISQMMEEAYQKLGKKAVIEVSQEERAITPAIEKEPDTKPKQEIFKKISPRARRKAKELGINAELVTGSSPDRAVIENDVIIYNQEHQVKISPTVEKVTSIEDKADKRIPYTGMRKIIGDRLSHSKFTAPHLYLTVSIDMTNITVLLKRYNWDMEERISINDFLIFVVAKVLSEQPTINCSLINEEIVYHKAVNIGVAVALEEGLIVPVIKDANQKRVVQLSQEVRELIKLARERKLIPEDYQGGTFTVSNLGMYGIENFTAIINPPEAAILSVGEVKKMPVVIEESEKIEIRSMMKATVSIDHRLIDGAIAATFLKQVKAYLEFPEGLL
jgi:pyruvate dehydrogenase E2 component (dihydrolipoamide acetyltransferase)